MYKECHNVIVKNLYNSITDEISSNIRNGMKKCASLGMNHLNDIFNEISLN